MINALFICSHCDVAIADIDEFFTHITECEENDEGVDAE